jgi:hypothetical protein
LALIEWPRKHEAELWEIENLIRHYQQLAGGTTFEIVRKEERPDWIVRDRSSGVLVGIELTSVYLDDRSVPDLHKRGEAMKIPYLATDVAAYGTRFADAVQKKTMLARTGYRADMPLILSIYANEYVTMHMATTEWEDVVRRHQRVFDEMRPFREVILWPLVNGGVLRIRPS